MSLTFKYCYEHPNVAYNIKTNSEEVNLAFVKQRDMEYIDFVVFKDNKYNIVRISKDNFSKINIESNTDIFLLDISTNDNFLNNTFLFNEQNHHKIKLLGYIEKLDEDEEEPAIRKLFFKCHDKFLELTWYSLSDYLFTDESYIGIKSVYNPNEFNFKGDNLQFNIYEPNDKSKTIINPFYLSGPEMLKNHEIKDCVTPSDIRDLNLKSKIKGFSFDGAILVIYDDLFISKLYLNYNDYKSVEKNEFLEKIFNIKEKEIENEGR